MIIVKLSKSVEVSMSGRTLTIIWATKPPVLGAGTPALAAAASATGSPMSSNRNTHAPQPSRRSRRRMGPRIAVARKGMDGSNDKGVSWHNNVRPPFICAQFVILMKPCAQRTTQRCRVL